ASLAGLVGVGPAGQRVHERHAVVPREPRAGDHDAGAGRERVGDGDAVAFFVHDRDVRGVTGLVELLPVGELVAPYAIGYLGRVLLGEEPLGGHVGELGVGQVVAARHAGPGQGGGDDEPVLRAVVLHAGQVELLEHVEDLQ